MSKSHLMGRALYTLGTCLSQQTTTRFDNALNYLAVGTWAKSRNYTNVPGFHDRYRLMEKIASEVADERVLYLEFGVYKGDSIKAWAKLLKNPESHLHGFDSFEGLPEEWMSDTPRGHFSTGGVMPVVDDPRVKFFKGWFDQVLPTYEFPQYDRLVVALDADLDSATQYVLDFLESRLKVGSILYFDEFRHRNHEMKAFLEFEGRTGWQFEVLGQSSCWEHAAFKRIR